MTLAVTRTDLVMAARPPRMARPWPAAASIARMTACPPSFKRYLYREVGRGFHWVDRLADEDAAIAAELARPGYEIWLASLGGSPAGYYELLPSPAGPVEICYFGLLPEFFGRGLGGAMLDHAVDRAWAIGASAVHVNTCTLDGPAALPNYRKAGFSKIGETRYTTALAPDRCDHCRALLTSP